MENLIKEGDDDQQEFNLKILTSQAVALLDQGSIQEKPPKETEKRSKTNHLMHHKEFEEMAPPLPAVFKRKRGESDLNEAHFSLDEKEHQKNLSMEINYGSFTEMWRSLQKPQKMRIKKSKGYNIFQTIGRNSKDQSLPLYVGAKRCATTNYRRENSDILENAIINSAIMESDMKKLFFEPQRAEFVFELETRGTVDSVENVLAIFIAKEYKAEQESTAPAILYQRKKLSNMITGGTKTVFHSGLSSFSSKSELIRKIEFFPGIELIKKQLDEEASQGFVMDCFVRAYLPFYRMTMGICNTCYPDFVDEYNMFSDENNELPLVIKEAIYLNVVSHFEVFSINCYDDEKMSKDTAFLDIFGKDVGKLTKKALVAMYRKLEFPEELRKRELAFLVNHSDRMPRTTHQTAEKKKKKVSFSLLDVRAMNDQKEKQKEVALPKGKPFWIEMPEQDHLKNFKIEILKVYGFLKIMEEKLNFLTFQMNEIKTDGYEEPSGTKDDIIFSLNQQIILLINDIEGTRTRLKYLVGAMNIGTDADSRTNFIEELIRKNKSRKFAKFISKEEFFNALKTLPRTNARTPASKAAFMADNSGQQERYEEYEDFQGSSLPFEIDTTPLNKSEEDIFRSRSSFNGDWIKPRNGESFLGSFTGKTDISDQNPLNYNPTELDFVRSEFDPFIGETSDFLSALYEKNFEDILHDIGNTDPVENIIKNISELSKMCKFNLMSFKWNFVHEGKDIEITERTNIDYIEEFLRKANAELLDDIRNRVEDEIGNLNAKHMQLFPSI